MAKEALEDLAPEERHRIYKLLRLNVYARPHWPLGITGVFADVEEEAETGLSSCKPSAPGSFPRDEPPTLNFRARLAAEGSVVAFKLPSTRLLSFLALSSSGDPQLAESHPCALSGEASSAISIVARG